MAPVEDLFVHSYYGRRWLYPPPARWVNHSDDPSCYQDFDRCCDIARRPIRAGEAVTIDAAQETSRELSTFLDAYVRAWNAAANDYLVDLIDSDAVLWSGGRVVRGRQAVVEALSALRPVEMSTVAWLIATGRWEALCSAEIQGCFGASHATLGLKVIAGNWQLRYQHQR